MGTGYTDILYVHLWEYRTPVQEVMRALDDVVRSGKALYVGISDAPAWVTASKYNINMLSIYCSSPGCTVQKNSWRIITTLLVFLFRSRQHDRRTSRPDALHRHADPFQHAEPLPRGRDPAHVR